MKKYKFVATCLFGLEKLLGEEIDSLGYTRIKTIDGRITFEGDLSCVARCNINLRFAERLYILIGSFKAESFDELFEGTRAIDFSEYIGKKDAFPVTGHAIKSKLFSIPDCQSIIKKAIVTSLSAKYGIEYFEETENRIRIEFFIFQDVANIMLDTSVTPLFKRGYRTQSNDAPLRETLAAAIVKLSRPRENVITWDPFCGSGTLAIEAALMMTNTAPGINRSFGAESFPFIDRKIWEDARNEARDNIKETEFMAYASDIDTKCITLTEANAKRAGMEKHIKIFHADATKIQKEDFRCTIVCNPPYGERLSDKKSCEELYRNMGKCFKNLSPWQIYLLTSHEDFQRLYGKRADKIRKLYNGMIKCNFYQYFKTGDKKK